MEWTPHTEWLLLKALGLVLLWFVINVVYSFMTGRDLSKDWSITAETPPPQPGPSGKAADRLPGREGP